MALSVRQEAFVREFLADMNGAAAATRAGYSPRSARQLASRLLGKPAVKAAIERAMDARAERVEVKQDDVLRALKRIANDDEERTGDRLVALNMLGRHLKMWVDRVEQTGPSWADLVLGAQRKRDQEEAKAGAAAEAQSAPEPTRLGEAPEPSPAPAAAALEPEIDAQPDPAPGRFNPLAYLRGGAA